jgi:hypothetical protein
MIRLRAEPDLSGEISWYKCWYAHLDSKQYPVKSDCYGHLSSPSTAPGRCPRPSQGPARLRLRALQRRQPPAGDHLNTPYRRRLRFKLNVKCGHKPNPKSGDQDRPTPRRIEGAAGMPIGSLRDVARAGDVPILRAVAQRLGGFPLFRSQLGPFLLRSGRRAFIVTVPGGAGPTQDLKSFPFGV